MHHVHRSAACAFAVVFSLSASARGDEDVLDQCVHTNTEAQALRHEGKLDEARRQLERCVAPACPDLVRGDCAQLLDDLERAQPTLVFDVKDEAGRDLTEVAVQMDGRVFAARLEGVALPANPGPHTFTFSATGRTAVTERLVVKEGEKGRRESVTLRTPGAADTGPVYPAGARASRGEPGGAIVDGLGPRRTFAVIVGAVGVAALGVSAALALVAQSKSEDANRFCPGVMCTDATALAINHEAMNWGNAASAVLVGGAAGVAAAATLWFAGGPAGRPRVAVRLAGPFVAVRGSW